MAGTWDTETYGKDFSFVHEYGNDVAKLIDFKPEMNILDLGCGNGALTKMFSDKGACAIGMDKSSEFVQTAQASYPELTFFEGDATNFSLSNPVDAVFSNAVLHWINKNDHPKMLKCVNKALKQGGQFVFECGGFKNNKAIHEALNSSFSHHGYHYRVPFYFPTITEYSVMLEEANFLTTYAILFDRPTPLKGDDGMKEWLEMFIKAPFEEISKKEQREIIEETVAKLRPSLFHDGIWYADYVRLRMKALKLSS